jgi:hypothetical protein
VNHVSHMPGLPHDPDGTAAHERQRRVGCCGSRIATTPPTYIRRAVADRCESIRARTYGFALAALWASWLATLSAFRAAWIAEP